MRRLVLFTSPFGPSVTKTVLMSGSARSCFSSPALVRLVSSSAVPAGSSISSTIWLRSSAFTKSDPMMPATCIVPTNAPIASRPTTSLWRSDQPRMPRYTSSIARNTTSKGRFTTAKASFLLWSIAFEKRDESIGSSVKATKSETSTAAETVRPNWRKNWPMMPLMNATGTNTATMVSVVARTLSAISSVPRRAASRGGSPRSRCLKMFSRTTTASSMSRPMASERPRSVIMFSVKPSTYMRKNVAMTLVGSANALMMVDRRSSMKIRMMRMAIAPPKTMAVSTSSAFSRMYSELSRMIASFIPAGNAFSSTARRSRTASAMATVLRPDCFTTSNETASSPFDRMRVRISSHPSSMLATSERRTAEPSFAVATTRARMASTVPSSPTARTLISRVDSS